MLVGTLLHCVVEPLETVIPLEPLEAVLVVMVMLWQVVPPEQAPTMLALKLTVPEPGRVGDQVVPVACAPPEQVRPLYQVITPAGLAPKLPPLAVSVVAGTALQMFIPLLLLMPVRSWAGVLVMIVTSKQAVGSLQLPPPTFTE
jgi:hypothetical protein